MRSCPDTDIGPGRQFIHRLTYILTCPERPLMRVPTAKITFCQRPAVYRRLTKRSRHVIRNKYRSTTPLPPSKTAAFLCPRGGALCRGSTQNWLASLHIERTESVPLHRQLPSDFQKPQVGNKTTLIQIIVLDTQQYPFFIPEIHHKPRASRSYL